jgi:hypothetical protein
MEFHEVYNEVINMHFNWEEVMSILSDVGKSVVFERVDTPHKNLITLHFQGGYLVSTFDSINFKEIVNIEDEKFNGHKEYLYRFQGLYSSWNELLFYNYIKENQLK